MKPGLHLKLAVGIILAFGLLMLAFALWVPVKTMYYTSKYHSDDLLKCKTGVQGLISMGNTGRQKLEHLVIRDFKYSPVKRRTLITGALIAGGEESQAILKITFPDGEEAAAEIILTLYLVPILIELANMKFKCNPHILCEAAQKDFRESVHILIACGWDVNETMLPTVRASWGGGSPIAISMPKTPLDCAKTEGMKQLLRSYGAKTLAELKPEQK